MQSLIKSLGRKYSKLLWYIRDVEFPKRSATAYFNFCIHTEMLYDTKTYEALFRFAQKFNTTTGKRITVGVSTPRCPLVMKAMKEREFPEEDFGERVRRISSVADIGYHGHFYQDDRQPFAHITRDKHENDAVIKQIREEFGWFKALGIIPKVYIAGCWVMTREIVLELERCGIEVDVSMRKGRTDTFGGRYLEEDAMPDYGKPFILPPSKRIVEIQSLFGPVMTPPLMKGHLIPYMEKHPGENAFFVFPLHDWDIPKYEKNIMKNIQLLNNSKDIVAWMDILDMRRAR